MTVSHGKSAKDWKTIATSPFAPVSGLPLLTTLPLEGGIKPPITRSSVLLPLPLRPSSATTSPSRTLTLTRSSTVNSPLPSGSGKALDTASTTMRSRALSFIDDTFVRRGHRAAATARD